MTWPTRLLLLFFIPLGGFVLWVFGNNVFPKPENVEANAVEAKTTPALDFPLISFVDPTKGSRDPSVTIIEYGDYSCPYCRQVEDDINRLLSEREDVRFVWKDLPSELHVGSDIAAEAAHCAKDQGRFWEYRAILFGQSDLFNHTSLTLSANEIGLDLDRFGACLSGREKRHLVEKSITEAEALGIDGIPYFFINGKRYSGQMSYEQLLEATR